MGFQKKRVNAHRHRRAHQGSDELAVANSFVATRAGALNRMGRIETDRRELAHDFQTPKIHHQRAITKRRAALGDEHVLTARTTDFLDRMSDAFGR